MNIGRFMEGSAMISRLKNYMSASLKRQLIFYIIIGVLCPLLIMMTILFAQNRAQMKRQAITNVEQKVETVTKEIELMLYNIHSVSNYNAYNEMLEEFTSQTYENKVAEKRRNIQRILVMFNNSDPLDSSIRIAAILNKYGELMNFMDPLADGPEIVEKIIDMDVYNVENLSKIIWHPLQRNFLIEGFSGNVRVDNIVIGTRRIVNFRSGAVNAVHIFAVTEEEIWNRYKNIMSDMISANARDYPDEDSSGSVYIIDSAGGLISSSDYQAVETGVFDQEIMDQLKNQQKSSFEMSYQGERYLVTSRQVANADWKIVAMIQTNRVTKAIDTLFIQIVLVAAVCTILCFFIILFISKRFLAPIGILKRSMQEVHDGNMGAYANMSGNGEIQEMGRYYNSMLRQINHFIKNKVATEKKKKQLEMEVIMGQVNPHFLYNTLENIVWKSSEAGYPEIGRLAASLGRLYRLSISSGQIVVKIQQEIEHLMVYMNIQKVRYKDRIDFDLLVDYEQIRSLMTIKLILQPAVENCFMYGLEGIHHTLKIRVRLKVFADSVRFEVIDNGVGMDQERLDTVRRQIREGRLAVAEEPSAVKSKGTGIGLYSISERIKLYFGKDDAVKIRSQKGRGTAVVITIPLVHQEERSDLRQN